MNVQKLIQIKSIDSANDTVCFKRIEERKQNCVEERLFEDFAEIILKKNFSKFAIPIEYGAQFLHLLKKEIWDKCTKYLKFEFEFQVQTDDEKYFVLNGINNKYYPISKLDLEFINAISIFILFRSEQKCKNDIFIFDLGIINKNDSYGFNIALLRYLYFVLKTNEFDNIYITYENDKNGKKHKEPIKTSSVLGGFGSTGFPVIPITENFYTIANKNIFDFLFNGKGYKNYQFDELKENISKVSERLAKNKKWSELVEDESFDLIAKKETIAIGIICAEIMDLLFKNIDKDAKILAYIKNASVLTFMMFASFYKGIYNPKDSIKTKTIRNDMVSDNNTFIQVFETCSIYASGCLQLIENVLCHTQGGFFSLRALKRDSVRNATNRSYVQIKSFCKNAEKENLDFLQICISDLAEKDNNINLIEKFKYNLKEIYKSELIVDPTLQDMFWAPKIQQSFQISSPEKKTYLDYRTYLTDETTISHHYGLQIFVFAVLDALGHFFVSTGNKNECKNFDSANQYGDMENNNLIEYIDMSKNTNLKYYCGTRYYIQLPIGSIIKEKSSSEYFGEYIPNDLTFEALEKTYEEISISLCEYINKINDIYKQKAEEVCRENNKKSNQINETIKNKIKYINNAIDDILLRIDQEISKNIHLYNCEEKENKNFKDLCDEDKKNIKYKIPIALTLNDNDKNKKFDLDNCEIPNVLEIIAKIVFGLVSKDYGVRNIVIRYFNNNVDVSSFARLFSNFYDRYGINNSLKTPPQILILYRNNNNKIGTEIALSGRYLGLPLFEYRNLSGGLSGLEDDFLRASLKTIGHRLTIDLGSNNNQRNNPHCFDNVNLETENNGTIKHWQRDLHKVLTSDLTRKDIYGVKINEIVTHMHISDVHLDRFYKVESLFTNAYWAGKLAEEIYNFISSQIKEYKNKTIVLYGYEHLLEPMFIKAKKICDKQNINLKYIIYDAGYHYSAEEVSESSISGYERIEKDIEECILIEIMSISTTLNTFKKMNDLFEKTFNSHVSQTYYYTIIQLYNEEKSTKSFSDALVHFEGADDQGIPPLFNGTIKFKEGICNYLISVPAKWYDPQNCPLCLLGNTSSNQKSNFERAIFSTDDTSLVPSFMVEQDVEDDKNKQQDFRSDKSNRNLLFFAKEENQFKYEDVLVHKHIIRNGSHYNNYIKTEMLVEKLNEEENTNKKSLPLKLLNNQFNRKKEEYLPLEIEEYINIIVAPYHNSNQMFPSLINDKIFKGKAHIISFNATKTFRPNFAAEFDNYSQLLEKINKRLQQQGSASELVKFYYVDDQINTGDTFNRTKSLVSELVENIRQQKEKFNFTAIFTLIDRHSKAFHRDLIENEDMFFSVFKLHSPNLRSSGDTCPLCKQVAQDKCFLEKASLDSTARICYKRIYEHKEEEFSKNNDILQNTVNQQSDLQIEVSSNATSDMRRFHVENLLYEAIKFDYQKYLCRIKEINKNNGKHINSEDKLQALYEAICNKVKNVCEDQSNEDMVEYLISFAKCLSRPFFSYRPYVATVAIKLLKDIIESLARIDLSDHSTNYITFDLNFKFDDSQTDDKTIKIHLKEILELKEKLISLLLVCVSGLANLNSTYIIKIDNLEKVLTIINKFIDEQSNIFSEIKTCTKSFIDMSCADYVRFSVFKVLHTQSFGLARRIVFEREVLKHIYQLLNEVKNEEKNKNLEEKLFFYLLLYFESEDNENEKKQNELNETGDSLRAIRVKRLKDKIVQQKSSQISIADDIDELFNNCLPYILNDNNEFKEKWLVPLTPEGYNDAYEIGYKLDKEKVVPVESCKYNQQLCGRIKLEEKVYQSLDKFGISIDESSEINKIDLFFVRFKFYEGLDVEEDTSLYLRFSKEELRKYGEKCITIDTIVNKNNDIIYIIAALREITKHRNAIIKIMKDILNTGAIGKLVADRELN